MPTIIVFNDRERRRVEKESIEAGATQPCRPQRMLTYVKPLSDHQAVDVIREAFSEFSLWDHHAVRVDDSDNLIFRIACSRKEISNQRPLSTPRYFMKLDGRCNRADCVNLV
jgi:hypothetical protein